MRRRRRMALGFVDQALSSASNILVMFAVARTSSVDTFGGVALVMMLLTTAMAITRGTFGTPLLLSGGWQTDEQLRELRGAQTGAFGIGIVVALAIMVVGTAQGAVAAAAALAVAAPVVLAQDVHRFAALSRDDQVGAVVWDGFWALGALLLLVMTWVDQGALSGVQVLGAWAGLAAISLVGLAMRSRTWPLLLGWVDWWRESHGHRVRYGLEGAIGALGSLIVVTAAAALIGAAAAAALRGAGTLMGPLSVLMAAIPLAVVPGAVRGAHSPERTRTILRKVATGMSFLALAVGSLGLVIPEAWGSLLLGDSWTVVSPILPITGIEYAGLAWISVKYTALRSEGRSRALLRARAFHASTSLIIAIAAVVIWPSAKSMAWGLAVAAAIVALQMSIFRQRPGDSQSN